MKDIGNFYSNKKVLVTGHTGFKGSWLSIWLKQQGADVIGIALDPKNEKDIFNLAGLSDKLTDYRQDIRDLEKLEVILAREQPEIVFHLAAQALVLESYNDPLTTFETNIIGTANILEACRHTQTVKQIIVVTTDKVYENKERMEGFKETDPLGGYDPYSASKAAAELITQSYRHSFFQPISQSIIQSINQSIPKSPNHPISQSSNHPINLSVSSARSGNVIGGGDWSKRRLIPDCIRALEAGEPILLRNPASIRPWQHVLEPLAGYLLLAMKMAEDPEKYSGAWNFGPWNNNIVSVIDVVDKLLSFWGNGSWKKTENENLPHEAEILRLDINKAVNQLGWRPLLNYDEAIKWTVDWYKNYSESDVYQLCSEQIEKYTEKWNSGNLK